MPTRNQRKRGSRTTYRQQPNDGRQQPWAGTDPAQVREPDAQPLSAQPAPQPDGVRSGTNDTGPSAGDADETARNAATRRTGLTGPRPPVELADAIPGEPNMPDEAGEASPLHPADPTTGREDVLNTSTSSGLHADDEGSDDLLKRQLRAGHQLPSRMD